VLPADHDSPGPQPHQVQVAPPSTSFTFRTLAGTHTIDVRPNETNEAALARHFGVDARRIVLQVLDGEWCVSVLDPFEIHHDSFGSPGGHEYRCPPGFIELYRQNLKKLDWSNLSLNPGAFDLLAEHLDKMDSVLFSLNSHPGAVALLAANLDTVNWKRLSMNAGAVDILAAHPEKIDWEYFSFNPNSRAIEMLAANLDTKTPECTVLPRT
jgi:hypothetical protein